MEIETTGLGNYVISYQEKKKDDVVTSDSEVPSTQTSQNDAILWITAIVVVAI